MFGLLSTVKLLTACLSYPRNTYSSPFHCFLVTAEVVVAGRPQQWLLRKALSSHLPDLSIMKMPGGEMFSFPAVLFLASWTFALSSFISK